jgi:fatty-acyl-CoA synthase
VEVPLLVKDFLRRAAKLYPDKPAIIDGDLRLTYRQYQERVNQLANALLAHGVRKGDRVCILSPNSHFFLESYYGVTQIGAILVPLNYRLVAADHEYIINHAGVKVVLVDYDYTKVMDNIRPQLKTVEQWIVAQESREAPEGWTPWETFIEGQPTTFDTVVEQDENDVLSINYTSGTTARPKGVMLTHRNSYINAYNFIANFQIRHDDVALWTLPMFHASGWGGPFALTAMAATHVNLRAVVGADIFRLIQDEKCTFACMAPAVISTILNFPDKANYHITTKPRFVLGGAPPPASYMQQIEEDLGWEFIHAYGLTETAPVLTISIPDYYNPTGKDYQRRARAGVEGIGIDLQLLDENGHPVPMDDHSVGEICVRSNQVLKGYWEQPEETERAIYGGYLHTGDLATWDAHANINIVDRKKDVIISGGENISSPEIEDVLYRHPAVLEVAVIGVPSEKWGETPKALVVLREGMTATEQEIISFSRQHLAHFKAPTSVDFVESLPRTVTGKLQKFLIRKQYWPEDGKRVN